MYLDFEEQQPDRQLREGVMEQILIETQESDEDLEAGFEITEDYRAQAAEEMPFVNEEEQVDTWLHQQELSCPSDIDWQ